MPKEQEKMSKKVPTQLNKQIESELEPFLDAIRKMDKRSANFKLFKQAVRDFSLKYGHAWKVFDYITHDMEWLTEYDAKEEIQTLFVYLGLVESLGNAFVDLVAMLIVANGVDFHIESMYETPRTRHANSIEDLESNKVPLGTKLNFLRNNGISKLVQSINNELRNDIAHLNFEIRSNQVYIKGKPSFELVTNSYRELLSSIKTVDILIRRLAKDRDLFQEEQQSIALS